jgi:glycosyltransferase involved in cell wall biosynthesis
MKTPEGPRPDVSVVVPLYNEVLNLPDLYRELTASLETLRRPFELILVDDGSTDGTRERLVELEERDARVRPVLLRRNFGQTAAFSAGFDRARGAVVVTSDGDLQNDPADIPLLVNRLEAEDLDMVCGWRKERKDPISKRLPSFFANRIISWATGVRLHDYGCSLKAMRSEVVSNLRLYGEMHRFIPAVASWMGVTLAEMPVKHRPRTRGSSKYGLGRILRVLLDLFTVKFLVAYGTRPAHFFGLLGLGFGFAGVAIWAYLSFLHFFRDTAVGSRPLLHVGTMLFVTAVILVSFGLVAELLVRVYHESQGKPTYVVKELRPAEEPEREPALPR